VDRQRCGGQEFAEFDQSLGDPRPLVEQGARGQERRERDVDDVVAARELSPERRVRVGHGGVAEELEFVGAGQADADLGACVPRAAIARPRVGVVACCHHRKDPVDVVDAAGHDAQAVE
jgi:hypothetical protein